jgi:hypothetical protein
MTFKVNNGRTIEVFQARDDGPVYVTTYDSKGEKESSDIISAGDFVMMLNWYRYQKENGNQNLDF